MAKTGFDAPRGVTTHMFDPAKLVVIGLDTKDGPEHELYDERIKMAVDEALADDLDARGQLEPIRFRRNGDAAEVVLGKQRVRSARLVNARRAERGDEPLMLAGIIWRGSATEAMEAIASENKNRRDNDAMIDARFLQRYLDRGGTIDRAAIAFGASKQTVSNVLRLLDTSTTIQKAVSRREIGAVAAQRIAALPREEQDAEFERMKTEGTLTTAEVTRTVRARNARKNGHEDAPGTLPAPKKRLLRKIMESPRATEAIDPTVRLTIGWLLGDVAPQRIKGLSALIASIEDGE